MPQQPCTLHWVVHNCPSLSHAGWCGLGTLLAACCSYTGRLQGCHCCCPAIVALFCPAYTHSLHVPATFDRAFVAADNYTLCCIPLPALARTQALLAQMLAEGYGCKQDLEESRRWAERARSRGYQMSGVYCEL